METSKSHDKITRKNIDSFEILPGNSHIIQSATEFQIGSIQDYTRYTYWDFVCTARSFLHKQVCKFAQCMSFISESYRSNDTLLC